MPLQGIVNGNPEEQKISPVEPKAEHDDIEAKLEQMENGEPEQPQNASNVEQTQIQDQKEQEQVQE